MQLTNFCCTSEEAEIIRSLDAGTCSAGPPGKTPEKLNGLYKVVVSLINMLFSLSYNVRLSVWVRICRETPNETPNTMPVGLRMVP